MKGIIQCQKGNADGITDVINLRMFFQRKLSINIK